VSVIVVLNVYHGSISVLLQTFTVHLLANIILSPLLYFSVRKVTRGEGENTGDKKMEKKKGNSLLSWWNFSYRK